MKALIAGALGLVGRNMADLLRQTPGWQVVGVARSAPIGEAPCELVRLDLTDGDACRQAAGAGAFRGVTHVFSCGRAASPEPLEEARLNNLMLQNLVDAVEAGSNDLQHVHLVHGTKWYGSHLGPFRTPAHEDDPRHLANHFYYDQQDWTAARAAKGGWTWSTTRPHLIVGQCIGYPHNFLNILGVYGALTAELGVPFGFPGSRAAFEAVHAATDVGLLNRAMLWAATTPACAGEAFNAVNGEFFRWCNLWPAFARFFGAEHGGVRPMPLGTYMADKAPVWQRLVERHGLLPHRFEQMASWAFADFHFSVGWDAYSSNVKAVQFGFTEMLNTETMFLDRLAEMRRLRLIP